MILWILWESAKEGDRIEESRQNNGHTIWIHKALFFVMLAVIACIVTGIILAGWV